MAEFVSEKRFQIVCAGALSGGESRGRGKGDFAGIAEKCVGVEDLAGERRRAARQR